MTIFKLSAEQASREYQEGFAAGDQQGIERAAQAAEPVDDVLAQVIRSLQSDPHWLEKRDAEVLKGIAVPMLLSCPKCGKQHVDEGEWAMRKHRTHQCQFCNHEWRPFEYSTFGIEPEVQVAAKARLSIYKIVLHLAAYQGDDGWVAWANERIEAEREASQG